MPISPILPVRRLENQVEIVAPTVATAFVLTGLANSAGKMFAIYNSGTANSLVQAADSSLIVTVQPGTAALLSPMSDAPATSAAWFVVTNGVTAAGIKGNTTGSAIANGDVGESKTQTRLISSALVLTSGTTANVTTTPLSLGLGFWLIYGEVYFETSGTAVSVVMGISATSATLPASSPTTTAPSAIGEYRKDISSASAIWTATQFGVNSPSYVVNLSASQTLYLVAQYTTGSCSVGGTIQATRIA